MLGGGFMGQMHQTNKQNREMLKKHRKDKKEFLSGAEKVESSDRKYDPTALTHEQQSVILRELDAKKKRQKRLSVIIFFGAIALATVLAYLFRAAISS